VVAVTTTTNPNRQTLPPGGHLALVPPPSGRTAAARVESIYRRRRVVAALIVAVVALVAGAALGALGGALTASGRSAPDLGTPVVAQVVEVAPGDTFWSIARRLQPDGDVRPLVDQLVRTHGAAVLHVGETIALPVDRPDRPS